MPNLRAQGGCGAEPAGLTGISILSLARIENIPFTILLMEVALAARANFFYNSGFY
jgi:hypothetical protein